MKNTVVLVIILHIITGKAISGTFSLMIDGNFWNGDYGVSESMRYTEIFVKPPLKLAYYIAIIPASVGAGSKCGSINFDFDYRLDSSNFSIYFSLTESLFQSFIRYNTDAGEQDIYLMLTSYKLGLGYTIGNKLNLWNTFFRFGLNVSNLQLSTNWRVWANPINEYGSFETEYVNRYGFNMLVGGRLNIPSPFSWIRLSVEPTISYCMVNLLTKTYSDSVTAIYGTYREKVNLNDASNPNDPNSSPRYIDYISLRVGLRITF